MDARATDTWCRFCRTLSIYSPSVSSAEGRREAFLRTKLSPPVDREVIPRRRAHNLLASGTPRRVTLIRGPAGWGKSSLLSSWSRDRAETRPFAWLAVDELDNDPVRFFTYLIEAALTLAPGIGVQSLNILRAPGADLTNDVIPRFISELESALPGPSVLVVDDYHLISSPAVHEGIEFLIAHMPVSLELVLSTRVEPPLPLARIRGHGELLEVSMPELRFSVDEADALLNGIQGLDLSEEHVRLLVERTEGWPAGLYLAALSLRHRDDRQAFIEAFAGDDRHLVDYLTSEVLAGQADEPREFLMTTSVLAKFNASLCDAVTGKSNSADRLREIERSNVFLVPLDDKRQWYRYHHLFAELLRHELRVVQPELEPDLDRRAAAWMLEEGLQSEAITHLLRAGSYSDAVELIAESWHPIASSGGHSTVRNWLDSLPPNVIENDARLCVARALVAISFGQLDEVEAALDLATQAPPPPGPFFDGFDLGATCGRDPEKRVPVAPRRSRRLPPSRHRGAFFRRSAIPLGLIGQDTVRCFELLAGRFRGGAVKSGTGARGEQRSFVETRMDFVAWPACHDPNRRG